MANSAHDLFTETTTSGIKALLSLSLRPPHTIHTPKQLAKQLKLSPTYLAKVMRLLARSGILHTQRGAHGGVSLARPPKQISLLHILEACQGKLLGAYCSEASSMRGVCGFHAAMADLQKNIVGTLTKWTLADLATKPCPSQSLKRQVACRMEGN